MSVRILFLGPLRDLAGRDDMQVEGTLNWDRLLQTVDPQVAAQLREERVNIACKGRVLADKTALMAEDGDEVALLPPVSGG